uniref:Uncharacterized protein n=1 Tax=Anguilla anguilla TaxID=7936 RepID=A0A0E9PB49_ANGAN
MLPKHCLCFLYIETSGSKPAKQKMVMLRGELGENVFYSLSKLRQRFLLLLAEVADTSAHLLCQAELKMCHRGAETEFEFVSNC